MKTELVGFYSGYLMKQAKDEPKKKDATTKAPAEKKTEAKKDSPVYGAGPARAQDLVSQPDQVDKPIKNAAAKVALQDQEDKAFYGQPGTTNYTIKPKEAEPEPSMADKAGEMAGKAGEFLKENREAASGVGGAAAGFGAAKALGAGTGTAAGVGAASALASALAARMSRDDVRGAVTAPGASVLDRIKALGGIK